MTSRIAIHGLLVALACLMANAPSQAQSLAEVLQTAPESEGPAVTDPAAENPEIDWSLLDVDAGTLTQRPAALAQRAKQAHANSEPSWSGHDQKDGAAALTVKQPLSPFWDTRAGADMTVARESSVLRPTDTSPQSSATAWLAMTAPGVGSVWDKTAIEARVDPSQAQTRLGTSLSKSVPLGGDQMALTLQNGTSVVQQGLAQVTGLSARPSRNIETEQSAKLSLTDTGTSLIAGQSLSTTDDKWLRKIGAEQKLFGEVTVAGSVSETATGALNRSLTAGFKHSW